LVNGADDFVGAKVESPAVAFNQGVRLIEHMAQARLSNDRFLPSNSERSIAESGRLLPMAVSESGHSGERQPSGSATGR
jgi:hypothetical protein